MIFFFLELAFITPKLLTYEINYPKNAKDLPGIFKSELGHFLSETPIYVKTGS